MNERIELLRYGDADEWTAAVAADIGDIIAHEIAQRGQARILLSGGTTPAPVYRALAEQALDWNQLEVGLVDERWLSPLDSSSNAWLVKHSFLEYAEGASFVPLVYPGKPINTCVYDANLQATHRAPACVAVLGMGGDGHTASLFPGSIDLGKALANPQPYTALDASGCPGANQWPLRITLTPAGLANVGTRLLLLRGKQKLEMLEAALAGEDPLQYPIRVAIGLPGARLRVYWCD
jgi:6-phosphogluconolactonase